MKIAITGHTSGIGKGILEYYSGEHEVIGFSLENGYNINDYNRILEETKDCDIFINNAYSHYTQSEIVSEWAKVHSNDKHLIISTSSIAAEPLLEIENMFPHLKPYGDEKYAINKASWNVNHSEALCKSSVIMPGQATEKEWLQANLSRLNRSYLTPNEPLDKKIQRFQQSSGLVPDGIPGTMTLIHINKRLCMDCPKLLGGM